MSIASHAIAETALAAQPGLAPPRKPPPRRSITPIADTVQTPEQR